MGIISFVKNAGSKLFKPKPKAVDVPENTGAAVESTVEAVTVSQADLDGQRGLDLENQIRALGLNINDLYVEVHDDLAIIHGNTESWDDKEKAIIATGNVEGISHVDDRIELVEPNVPEEEVAAVVEEIEAAEPKEVPAVFASHSASASEYYTVVKGDSLSRIAKRFYGNALKYPIIFEANQPMLRNPNLIYPGQVLRIPPLNEGGGFEHV